MIDFAEGLNVGHERDLSMVPKMHSFIIYFGPGEYIVLSFTRSRKAGRRADFFVF